MTTAVVIVAAGRGERFGTGVPKQFTILADRPLLAWSVAAFTGRPDVDTVVVVTNAEFIAEAHALVGDGVRVVAGGATRADSVRCGLAALADLTDEATVLVHDAARPLVSDHEIAAVLDALTHHDAVTVAVPSSDTILEVEGAVVTAIPARDRLWRAQTPQGFRLGVLRGAHDAAAADASFVPTDDCGVVATYGTDVAIAVVAGTERNLKVTHPGDLAVAERLIDETG